MATVPVQSPNDSFDKHSANRKVWVLNSYTSNYTEVFRGNEITIPANNMKIPRDVKDGGNLMGFLAARKFLGQPKAAAELLPNGQYKTPPKALRTVELDPNEQAELSGQSKSELKRQEFASLESKEERAQEMHAQAIEANKKKTPAASEKGDKLNWD